jgi:uncharacterized phage protein gp47/JayE
MAFSRPTLQTIVDRIKADFVAKITGATTLALRSVLLVMGTAYAGAVHLLYGYLENQSRELFVKTATGDAIGGRLDTHGSEYGVLRKEATSAQGTVACTGVATTVIPAGSALVSDAGNRYTTDALATIGGAGTVDVAVTCDTAGEAGNDSAAVVLAFESVIIDVDSTAVVDANALAGGTDEEIDEAYRLRILSRKQFAPAGGAEQDIINWCLEVADVTRAWVYKQYQGPGTFAVYFVCDGQSPITPTPAQLAAVVAYLTAHTDTFGDTVGIPVTALPGMFVLAPVLKQMDYTIKLYPNTVAVQTTVTAQIDDFLLREGYPANTLYLSRLVEAIGAAVGEERSQVVGGADAAIAYNEVAVRGTLTWQDY